MPNQSGNAYGLTALCPLKELDAAGNSVTIKLKNTLLNLEQSFLSVVPNTYLARFYILEDVFYEDYPYDLEHLKSKYLVFTSNFHGELEPYLRGMYDAMEEHIKIVWQDCYGFDGSNTTASSFIEYIKKCQVETTFFFNGSTDQSRQDQLKGLYLKQEFSDFVFENSTASPEQLLASFKEFVGRTNPKGEFPRWKAGGTDLGKIVENG